MPELIFLDDDDHDFSVIPKIMQKEIESTLLKNQQIIIFRNRRGYSTFLQCSACLTVDQCPNCDVSLTFHLNQGILKCHYCGFSKNESKICNSCGLQTLERKGMGTQLVEDEIQKLYPNYRVGRLDYDTTRKKTSFKNIISGFENNDYQILGITEKSWSSSPKKINSGNSKFPNLLFNSTYEYLLFNELCKLSILGVAEANKHPALCSFDK